MEYNPNFVLQSTAAAHLFVGLIQQRPQEDILTPPPFGLEYLSRGAIIDAVCFYPPVPVRVLQHGGAQTGLGGVGERS